MSSKSIDFRLIIVVLFAAVLFYSDINSGLNVYDEGVGLTGARLVTEGQQPYTDFWTMYAPGVFYLYSWIADISGPEIVSIRQVAAIMLLLIPVFSFLISKRLFGPNYGLASALTITILLGGFSFWGKAVLPALLSLVAMHRLIVLWHDKESRWALVGISSLMFLIVFFRHDFLAYSLPAFLGLTFLLFIRPYPEQRKWLGYGGEFICLWGPFLILSVITAYHFASYSGFDKIYEQLIRVPTEVFPEYRDISLPAGLGFGGGSMRDKIISIVFLVVLVLLVFFIFRSLYRIFTNKDYKVETYIKFSLAVTGLFLSYQSWVRTDLEHFVPALVFAVILLPWMMKKPGDRIMGFGIMLMIAIVPLGEKMKHIKMQGSPEAYECSYGKMAGLTVPRPYGPDLEQSIKYLDSVGCKYLFVGNRFHDRILLNDVIIYYLSEAAPATKYNELHPGVATTLPVQQDIIRQLKKRDNLYFISCDNTVFEYCNESAISSGVYKLDAYLGGDFEKVISIGKFDIYKKKAYSRTNNGL